MEERVKQEREAIQNLELDARLWQTLSALPSEDVCRRSLTSYDGHLHCYHIRVLNESYWVLPREMAIHKADDKKGPLSIELRLMILHYLINPKNFPSPGGG